MLIVAIVGLGFYLCLTGVRLAILRGRPFAVVDKAIVLIGLLVVVFLLGSAVVMAIKQYTTYAVLCLVFGLLYAWVIGSDALQIFRNKKLFMKTDYGKMNWYLGHLTKLGASYITAVGAFVAVQDVFHNTLANFILPGVIGTILLNISRRYFIKKLNLVPVVSEQ
jgi:hypothetical protein